MTEERLKRKLSGTAPTLRPPPGKLKLALLVLHYPGHGGTSADLLEKHMQPLAALQSGRTWEEFYRLRGNFSESFFQRPSACAAGTRGGAAGLSRPGIRYAGPLARRSLPSGRLRATPRLRR